MASDSDIGKAWKRLTYFWIEPPPREIQRVLQLGFAFGCQEMYRLMRELATEYGKTKDKAGAAKRVDAIEADLKQYWSWLIPKLEEVHARQLADKELPYTSPERRKRRKPQ